MVGHHNRRGQADLEHRGHQLVGDDRPDTKVVMSAKDEQLVSAPAGTPVFRSQCTAGKVRWGTIARLAGRSRGTHRLPTAQDVEHDGSGPKATMSLKPRPLLVGLEQHSTALVPIPAGSRQLVSRSVQRAMGASHRTAGWACKAPGQAADLVRLRSARRGLHRRSSGQVQDPFPNCP